MGTLIGHVLPGFSTFLIGLWHLFNHIKIHSIYPDSYTGQPWFPTSKFKYFELFFLMANSLASIAMELFVGLDRHQPFDPDGTIPSNHLHNFEHSSISGMFLIYASFGVVLDRTSPKARNGLTFFLGALAYAQELFLFHLHSADHKGPEGQYHWLLQVVLLVSLITTLMGIGLPKSFMVSFVRSLSIIFQGVWFITMGFMLWTPELVPKGCFLNYEDGHQVVRCSGEEALHRAKSLINLQFSWVLVGVVIFGVSFYMVLIKIYSKKM